MHCLNDPNIRSAFIEKLNRLPNPPKRIIEELPVHKGNAIADIVAIYEEPHCYEIKGESDNISRVLTQGKFYDKAFRKITLITTLNHKKRALSIAPATWGIIEAKIIKDRIVFIHIRKATLNKCIEKKLALQTLWRSELLDLASTSNSPTKKNATRDQLISALDGLLSNKKASMSISAQLLKRNKTNK
jgi:hypothetical protein